MSRPSIGASAPPGAERRIFLGKVELRAAPEGSKSPGTLVGYAAVFNQFSVDMGGWREMLAAGCFRGCMGDDVRGLLNHDVNNLLGRSTAGTLRFEEDGLGLRTEIDLANTQCGRDTAESVDRGDITGMSFSFDVALGGDEWNWNEATAVRTVSKVSRIYDVGPVAFPAYEGTSCSMRSFERARDKRNAEVLAAAQAAMQLSRARQRLCEAATG